MKAWWLIAFAVFGQSCAPSITPPFYIATASSFAPPLQALMDDMGRQCSVGIRISSGSTGKLVTQMSFGGPFDVLISADPALSQTLLKARSDIVIDRPFARSPLAYWQPETMASTQRIAIANPDIAPFGRAAMEVLNGNIPAGKFPELVLGNSAATAFSFVYSGAAKAGYVPLSLLIAADIPDTEYQLVEPASYGPIWVQVIHLKPGPKADCIARYLAKADLSKFGYLSP